jgi:Holliday junction DNA helicase RuvB
MKASDIDHYGQWSNLFRERPEIHDQVRQLVDHEASLPEGNNPWADDFVSKRCWATKDVTGVAPNTVNLLHRRGLLEKHGSNKSKYYSIIDLGGAKLALEDKAERFENIGDDIERVEYEPPRIPEELFATIEGYDDIKQMFYWAIEAPDPVHIALKGPPASAKTVFLQDIDTYLPRSLYAEGYDSSKAGIREQLLEERPWYYLIDEFGEMHPKHLAVLRGLCGQGRVTENLAGRHRSIYLPTRLFAACNRWPPDPDGAFRSRIELLVVDQYRPGEFEQIATTTLVKREGVAEDIADYIVERLKKLTLDVRAVVRVARLCPTVERVDRYLEIKLARGGF